MANEQGSNKYIIVAEVARFRDGRVPAVFPPMCVMTYLTNKETEFVEVYQLQFDLWAYTARDVEFQAAVLLKGMGWIETGVVVTEIRPA